MPKKDLDTRFEEAVAIANTMTQESLPQDIQLRLYAFYKQATFGTIETQNNTGFDIRNAFKTNAWMQISHFTIEEAKEAYIELIHEVNKQINKK
jgi:acyl-CoA-binding protein